MNKHEATDAVALMERDHQVILALFESYAELVTAQGAPQARKALTDEICMEITIHMRLENEMFYPVARVPSGGSALLDGADADHAETREQIAQLLGMQAEEPGYDAKVLGLGELILRHVAEERAHLFPAVRISGVDLSRLAGRVRERRLELQTVTDALREWAMLPAYA
jgi:hypothetical protein